MMQLPDPASTVAWSRRGLRRRTNTALHTSRLSACSPCAVLAPGCDRRCSRAAAFPCAWPDRRLSGCRGRPRETLSETPPSRVQLEHPVKDRRTTAETNDELPFLLHNG